MSEAEMYERLRKLESTVAVNGEKFRQIREEQISSGKQIDDIQSQISDIHSIITKYKGFVGGATLVISLAWAIFGGFVVVFWKSILDAFSN